MEYCSHVWGGSKSMWLLDRIENKARRLINSDPLFFSTDSLTLRRRVGSLSLFYKYYYGHCSREVDVCIPPPCPPTIQGTRLLAYSYQLSLDIPRSRISRSAALIFPPHLHFGTIYPRMFSPVIIIWMCLRRKCVLTFAAYLPSRKFFD